LTHSRGQGASSFTSVTAGVPEVPTRDLVAGQVAWRTLVCCVAGGAAVATALAVPALLLDWSGSMKPSDLLAFPFGGAFFGFLLSFVAVPAMAIVCAFALVPYRGPRLTLLLPRVLGAGLVAALVLPWLTQSPPEWQSVVFAVLLVSFSAAGVWVGGGWITGWYVRRMRA
jgi:hypothetical protein